uniref:NADP-linked methylene tetrahydromethanopterin dehydrogenase n=1 Tax=uncultured bacterium BAC10-10 TaxID=333372 RepID=Q4JIQ0_9BACT|nr:NADP-linked methylene tetrahydromethanopterin dehydrogenase [uncultured bacterium BAC10-10]
MRTLLLQLDTSPNPSVFDRVVAYDGGADEIMSCSGVTPDSVRDLVHGAIFTRGPKDLHNTAIFIGGTDMAAGEKVLAVVRDTFFGPMRVSVMLDSNGSNTTAVAAVVKLQKAGDVRNRRVVVTAATGPVGMRAAGLLAQAGADVTVTSRRVDGAAKLVEDLKARFGCTVRAVAMADASQAAGVLEGCELLLSAGGFGVRLVPREAWARQPELRAVADVNAVPPLGVEGIEAMDDGVEREGVLAFGALGIGGFKMKLHKACIAKLFERNDLVLDAESILDVAGTLSPPRG